MRCPRAVGEPFVVWEGPYPNKVVTEQEYEFPDGSHKKFFLWGKTAGKPAVVFPVTEARTVIVTRQWRPGSDGWVYEYPGGNVEPGQTLREALASELRQETGYEAADFIKLPEFFIDPPSCRVAVAGFLAVGCRKVGEPKPEPSEVIEKVEFPVDEWLGMCLDCDSQRKDSKTLAITLLAMPHLMRLGLVDFGAVEGWIR
jgi:ADP-ribose pyrophosphatase